MAQPKQPPIALGGSTSLPNRKAPPPSAPKTNTPPQGSGLSGKSAGSAPLINRTVSSPLKQVSSQRVQVAAPSQSVSGVIYKPQTAGGSAQAVISAPLKQAPPKQAAPVAAGSMKKTPPPAVASPLREPSSLAAPAQTSAAPSPAAGPTPHAAAKKIAPVPNSSSMPNLLRGLPLDRVGPKRTGAPPTSMPKIGFHMPDSNGAAETPNTSMSPPTSPRGPLPPVPAVSTGQFSHREPAPSMPPHLFAPGGGNSANPNTSRRVSRNVEAIVSPRRIHPGVSTESSAEPALEQLSSTVDAQIPPGPSRRQARFARRMDASDLLEIRNQQPQPEPVAVPTTIPATQPPPALSRSTSAGVVPARNAIISPPRRSPVASQKPSELEAQRSRARLESNAYGVRPAAEYKSVLQAALPLQGSKAPVEIEEEKDDIDDVDTLPPEFWAIEQVKCDLLGHRDRVANEILTSEQSFNLFLRVCIFSWERPMLNKTQRGDFGPNVKREHVAKLFGGIEGVYGASSILMQELQKRFKEWSPTQLVGDIFLKFGDLLKLFAIYTKDHEQSIQTLQTLSLNPAISTFLSERTSHHLSGNKSLDYFLIMPVQRVPRYEMLLRDLLKETPLEHPDYANLAAALEKIKTIAHQVDQSVEQRKKVEKILSIEKSVVNNAGLPFLAPGRDFIKEGPLVKLCRKDKKKRMFFLFTDILVYCSFMVISGKYAMSGMLPLSTTTISEVSDYELGPRAFEGALCFKIQSPTKSFIVFADTPQSKADWVYELMNAIAKAKERSRNAAEPVALAPVMQQAQEASKCNGCGKSFSLILRKKHCHQCGVVVCADCLSEKCGVDGEKTRVCNRCVSIYGSLSK